MEKFMKVYRKVGQIKFIKKGLKGLLTIHDFGKIAVSMDHKVLFVGLDYYDDDHSYFCIDKPTTRERKIIFDRLFDMPEA